MFQWSTSLYYNTRAENICWMWRYWKNKWIKLIAMQCQLRAASDSKHPCLARPLRSSKRSIFHFWFSLWSLILIMRHIRYLANSVEQSASIYSPQNFKRIDVELRHWIFDRYCEYWKLDTSGFLNIRKGGWPAYPVSHVVILWILAEFFAFACGRYFEAKIRGY